MEHDPGKYDRRVAVLGVTRVPDGGGGYDETVGVIGEVWAKVEPLVGDEQLRAMQSGVLRPFRFKIPFRPGLDETTGVEYGGTRYDVKSVMDPDAAHVEIVMLADQVYP